MSPSGTRAKGARFDYTAVGHVTIDVMPDGSRRPGGGAFYAALQAARLGRRALILTRGVRAEIDALLEPYRGELELQIESAPHTTTLQTWGEGGERKQRVLAWAGALRDEPAPSGGILHLAPVAREGPERWGGSAGFVGLTPQGLVRSWTGVGAEFSLLPASAAGRLRGLGARCDAIVVSELERESCAPLLEAACLAGAVVAVTHGPRPTSILHGSGEGDGGGVAELPVPVPELERVGDDLGAGDVFAAAFFLALHDGLRDSDAARFANAAAAVRMLGTGPGSIGDRAAIDARIDATSPGSGS